MKYLLSPFQLRKLVLIAHCFVLKTEAQSQHATQIDDSDLLLQLRSPFPDSSVEMVLSGFPQWS